MWEILPLLWEKLSLFFPFLEEYFNTTCRVGNQNGIILATGFVLLENCPG